ncbi:MAG: hypothetical protein PHC28_05910 [Flavobacterium sp.]|uniref:hypothetical protein n=1 Tax=Flavobacterium sp. TaxID=239 RepID=UPI0026199642|nr:hypothetical protein [Flavobacterium sp.]MDD5150004.1 hypothetical protein [Flavobacterium sp.]
MINFLKLYGVSSIILLLMILAVLNIVWASNLVWLILFLFATLLYIVQFLPDEYILSTYKNTPKNYNWCIYLVVCGIAASMHWYFLTIYFLISWLGIKGKIITLNKEADARKNV